MEPENLDRVRVYSFDVGFSFAGEARPIVEAINEQLKSEDIITFYDFDQQAVLLALALEEVLGRIYAESCRYYLVFLDQHYQEKVWTKYEKDILTKSGRKEHIVPIVLDDIGARGALGVPISIGRVDLRESWSEMLKTKALGVDVLNTLRNRCILPVLEKLDISPVACCF
jgi:hypothetical protein